MKPKLQSLGITFMILLFIMNFIWVEIDEDGETVLYNFPDTAFNSVSYD